MTTVLWESDDQFATIQNIWQDNILQYSAKVFADLTYAYVCERTITRLVTGSGVERNTVVISPAQLSYNSYYLLSNYLTEWGLGVATVVIEVVDGRVWYGPYPPTAGLWTLASGINVDPVDVVFPDIPESPRFVVGVSGAPHGIVILAASGLIDRYDTNWSAMTTSATVTDLEATRII